LFRIPLLVSLCILCNAFSFSISVFISFTTVYVHIVEWQHIQDTNGTNN
jgi:hypothetical protein